MVVVVVVAGVVVHQSNHVVAVVELPSPSPLEEPSPEASRSMIS